MSNEIQFDIQAQALKLYVRPQIVHELTLETRAGSPLGGGGLIDPLGLDPTLPQ